MDNLDFLELFPETESLTIRIMQNMFLKLIIVTELKSKITLCEDQKQNLKEYIKLLQTITHKSFNDIQFLKERLINLIQESEKSVNNLKKAIEDLESQKKQETTSNKSKNLVVRKMKNILSNSYSNNFNLFIQKEKRLLELQNEIKENNTSYVTNAKQELDNCIKKYDLSKSKNKYLNKILSMNIKQNIN